ncbi:MAG: hypothetical protein AAGK33_04550 [Pseudomonadota bacterium]
MSEIILASKFDGLFADYTAAYAPSISGDGRFIVFAAETEDARGSLEREILLYDTSNDTLEIISVKQNGTPMDGHAYDPMISDDGQFIVYMNDKYLPSEGDSNILADVFLHDINSSVTTILSNGITGTFIFNAASYPSISGNGEEVVFVSGENTLASNDKNTNSDVFRYDANFGTVEALSTTESALTVAAYGNSYHPEISSSGDFVAYVSYRSDLVPNDTNQIADVFLYSSATGQTSLVSGNVKLGNGYQFYGKAVVSADGQHIAYVATDSIFTGLGTLNNVQIILHNSKFNTDILIFGPNSIDRSGASNNDFNIKPDISDNGAFVVYHSSNPNIVAGDNNGFTDIFVYNAATDQTAIVSVNALGEQANADSVHPSISADGKYITFQTYAYNMHSGDTDAFADILRVANPLFGSAGWYYGWTSGWHVGWVNGWHESWNYSWFYGWSINWHTSWHVGWHVGWNVGWHFANGGWSNGWFYGWANGWNYGWTIGWTVGWAIGWNYGWVYGWHIGWANGWHTDWLLN